MAEGKEYVERLMRIRCTCGSIDNYINIPQDHGVVAGEEQQPLMNANDHMAGEHIIHFGNCNSDLNPERVFRKNLVGGLLGGTLLGGVVSDFLEDTGIMSFKCTPKTDKVWKLPNEKHLIDGAPALTMDSCLTCRYGGIITLVPLDEYPQDNAQNEGNSDDAATNGQNEGTSDDAAQVDTVQEETMAAMTAAFDKISATGAEISTEGNQEQTAANPMAQTALIAASAQTAVSALSTYQNKMEFGDKVRKNAWERPFVCSDKQRELNYANNCAIPFEGDFLDSGGRITNQEMLGNYQINNFSIKTVGSGAVAAFNVMRLLQPENTKSFAEVIYEMEMYGVMNSAYGLMPCGITDYMVRQGYDVNYELEDMEQKVMEADAGILLSVTQNYTHYAAVQKDITSKKLNCFNARKNITENTLGSVMVTVNKKRNGG